MIYVAAAALTLYQLMDFLYQADQHAWIWSHASWGERRLHTWRTHPIRIEVGTKAPHGGMAYTTEHVENFRLRLRRGEKWHWALNWIPHDGWHAVQFLRTTMLMTGFLAFGLEMEGHWWLTQAGVLVALYAATRAVAFTIPMHVAREHREALRERAADIVGSEYPPSADVRVP
jgi:hypothetical protein